MNEVKNYIKERLTPLGFTEANILDFQPLDDSTIRSNAPSAYFYGVISEITPSKKGYGKESQSDRIASKYRNILRTTVLKLKIFIGESLQHPELTNFYESLCDSSSSQITLASVEEDFHSPETTETNTLCYDIKSLKEEFVSVHPDSVVEIDISFLIDSYLIYTRDIKLITSATLTNMITRRSIEELAKEYGISQEQIDELMDNTVDSLKEQYGFTEEQKDVLIELKALLEQQRAETEAE